jgi:hypothetical protein
MRVELLPRERRKRDLKIFGAVAGRYHDRDSGRLRAAARLGEAVR